MSLGPWEIIIIFVVILLVFGGKKLPELARGLGKRMGEFKRARDDFEDEIKMAEMEVSKEEEEKTVKAEEAKHKEEASASETS